MKPFLRLVLVSTEGSLENMGRRETIRLKKEIDENIEQHGGRPGLSRPAAAKRLPRLKSQRLITAWCARFANRVGAS